MDVETSWYYLQTRYYDPVVRRFINADNYELIPFLSGSIGELNLYSYCNNNPVMYTDETGQSVFLTMLIIGIVIGAAIGGGTKGYSAYQSGARGWELAGSISSGALVGGAMGAALVLGGAAGLATTGATVAGFGLSTAAALGVSIAAGVGAGALGYSIEAAAYKDKQWNMSGFALSGLKGGLQAAVTFGAGYFGGKNGLFNKMGGFRTMDAFYVNMIATKGSIGLTASVFHASSLLVGEAVTKGVFISGSAALARWLIDQMFA